MVQFFQLQPEYKKPSGIGQSLGMAGQTGVGLLEKWNAMQKEKAERADTSVALDENAAIEDRLKASARLPSVKQIEIKKIVYSNKNKSQTLQQAIAKDPIRYEKLKEQFGEIWADQYMAAAPGERTKLWGIAERAMKEQESIDDVLRRGRPTAQDGEEIDGNEQFIGDRVPEKLPQIENGKISKDMEWPVFTTRPKGYTNKDWVEVKKEWRKENNPIAQDNRRHLQLAKKDTLATKTLENLNESDELPEGVTKFIIDSETGEVKPWAKLFGKVPVAAQQWAKVIAQFNNRAKEAYGSRVTNFDLTQYMKQFPDLLNTKEGRTKILSMMKINYELDELYANALDQIYSKYGHDGIPQEQADTMARRMTEDRKEQLENEYLSLSTEDAASQEVEKDLGEETDAGMLKELGAIKGVSEGKIVDDPDTGKAWKLIGGKWKRIQ